MKKTKSNDVVLRVNNMKFTNGASYSGAIKDVFDSRPHGHGIYFYPDHLNKSVGNHYYRGNFNNSKFHGHGEYVSKQYTYKGEFKNQKFHGKGEYSRDGYSYKGDFKNDLPHGNGEEIFLKKDSIFIGTFKNGKKHGYVVEKSYKNKKVIFKGQYKNGQILKGIFDFQDGGIYEGNFRNSAMHGKGILKETKGKKAGEVYEGTWKDGYMEGIFIVKNKKGKKTKKLYKKDVFIKYIK